MIFTIITVQKGKEMHYKKVDTTILIKFIWVLATKHLQFN